MTKDEEYRYYALVIFRSYYTRDHYFNILSVTDGDKRTKHCIWLTLMGLMETWDIK